MTVVGQPEATEYAPYYEHYVALVRGSDIVKTLEEQWGTVRRALSAVPEDRAGFMDAPPIPTAPPFARGEKAPLPSFDENEYARQSGHDRLTLVELVEEFESVRRGTVFLLRHFRPEAWLRVGVASGKPVSVRALAHIMAGHVAHHLAILHERYGVPIAG